MSIFRKCQNWSPCFFRCRNFSLSLSLFLRFNSAVQVSKHTVHRVFSLSLFVYLSSSFHLPIWPPSLFFFSNFCHLYSTKISLMLFPSASRKLWKLRVVRTWCCCCCCCCLALASLVLLQKHLKSCLHFCLFWSLFLYLSISFIEDNIFIHVY